MAASHEIISSHQLHHFLVRCESHQEEVLCSIRSPVKQEASLWTSGCVHCNRNQGWHREEEELNVTKEPTKVSLYWGCLPQALGEKFTISNVKIKQQKVSMHTFMLDVRQMLRSVATFKQLCLLFMWHRPYGILICIFHASKWKIIMV